MSVVMDIIRIAVVVAVRFINQRQKAVETEKNREIREVKDKKFNPKREYALEPSSAQIAEKQ